MNVGIQWKDLINIFLFMDRAEIGDCCSTFKICSLSNFICTSWIYWFGRRATITKWKETTNGLFCRRKGTDPYLNDPLNKLYPSEMVVNLSCIASKINFFYLNRTKTLFAHGLEICFRLSIKAWYIKGPARKETIHHNPGWWVCGHSHTSTGTCRNLKKWPPTELIRRPYEIVNLIPTGEIWRSYSQPKLCDDLDLTEGVEQKKGLSRYVVCFHFKVAGYCLFLLFFFFL